MARDRQPQTWPFMRTRITVRQMSQTLNIPLQTAYWHFWRAGGNMERAFAEADRARTERAARRIVRIITEGGGA